VEGIPRKAVREGDNDLHSEEECVCTRGDRCIRLVELVNASREKVMMEKRLAACRQDEYRGDAPLQSHCCNLHAQASISVNHPNDVRHCRAGSQHHDLCDAVQAVWLDRRDLLTHRHTPTVHLRADAEQGGT
jgi:hypothetical protein